MNQKKMSTERTEGNKFSRSKIVFCVIYAAILLEAVLMGKIQGLDFTQNLVNIVTAVICIINHYKRISVYRLSVAGISCSYISY